jgi:hypothetical protein
LAWCCKLEKHWRSPSQRRVGNTTLAADLGTYLAKDWQKRVLLIDLDFQG